MEILRKNNGNNALPMEDLNAEENLEIEQVLNLGFPKMFAI